MSKSGVLSNISVIPLWFGYHQATAATIGTGTYIQPGTMYVPNYPEPIYAQLGRIHIIIRDQTGGIGFRSLCGIWLPPTNTFLTDIRPDQQEELCKTCQRKQGQIAA